MNVADLSSGWLVELPPDWLSILTCVLHGL